MYVSCSENRKCGHVPLHCRTVASLPPHRAVVADLVPLAFSIKQLKRHTRPHLIRTSIYIYKFNVLNIQRISPNRILPCNFLALNWENFETFLELFSLRYASADTVGVLCVSMYYKKTESGGIYYTAAVGYYYYKLVSAAARHLVYLHT